MGNCQLVSSMTVFWSAVIHLAHLTLPAYILVGGLEVTWTTKTVRAHLNFPFRTRSDSSWDEDLVRNIVENSKIVLVQVDYRLCPEDPFPAGLDDCCEAYEWVRVLW